jgi:hypothetical protein
MEKWVKGEGEGCRPCKIATVGIGRYRKALQEAGLDSVMEPVSKILDSEDVDTIGKVAATMDQIKATATPDLRAVLESIDCDIQKKEECGLCQDVPDAQPAEVNAEG